MIEFTEFKITKIDTYYKDKTINIEAIQIEEDLIIDYVKEHLDPEMVFSNTTLVEWAEQNGYKSAKED